MNTSREHSCQNECRQQRPDYISDMALAMAYVPWQHYQSIYEPDKALQVGTIFPELNKPFTGRRVCRKS